MQGNFLNFENLPSYISLPIGFIEACEQHKHADSTRCIAQLIKSTDILFRNWIDLYEHNIKYIFLKLSVITLDHYKLILLQLLF